jgi:malate dehydrogenase (oxaloacetate-decarboxylating)(NADP+)
VLPQEISTGNIFPSLTRIREVSGRIAVEVAREVFREGLSRGEEPADLAAHVESLRYEPEYPDYA